MSVDLVAVCVFCGSNRGASQEYEQAARDVGRLLAEQGIRLVYGGASEGLMGVVADAALAAGGLVTGVMSGFFEPTMQQLDRMVAEGFVRREHRDGIYFDDQPARLLRRLDGFESPDIHKWIDRDLTP